MKFKRTQYLEDSITRTHSAVVEYPETRKALRRNSLNKSASAEIAIPSKFLSETYDSDITISEWNKTNSVSLVNKNYKREPNVEIPNVDLKVLKLTDNGMEKMEWRNLHDGMKKAFNEVINTFLLTGRKDASTTIRKECFTFGYSDSEIDFTAVCILMKRSATFLVS